MEERLREGVQNLLGSELPPHTCLERLSSILVDHQPGKKSQSKLAT